MFLSDLFIFITDGLMSYISMPDKILEIKKKTMKFVLEYLAEIIAPNSTAKAKKMKKRRSSKFMYKLCIALTTIFPHFCEIRNTDVLNAIATDGCSGFSDEIAFDEGGIKASIVDSSS